jgi:pimeloyl-ACP methyl ester carboxylesterase
MPAAAEMPPFPVGFRNQDIPTNGVTLHVRTGGQGPAAILLHGYGETGDMWAPLAHLIHGVSHLMRPPYMLCRRNDLGRVLPLLAGPRFRPYLQGVGG